MISIRQSHDANIREICLLLRKVLVRVKTRAKYLPFDSSENFCYVHNVTLPC
jgi:hypothetical protein